jgi:solute carrier family 35 (GDP-fucose transporter), member C1
MKPEAEKPASKALVTGVVLFYLVAALAMVMANKWVLNTTDTPLFFLWTQLAIAALLFVVCDLFRALPDRLSFDMATAKEMGAVVGLNVVGLSFSNYTLKYVDASFYQVARGLVLPFTVVVSFIFLHARPSLKVLSACGVVTLGFFVGVFLDGTPVSMLGIFFGVASSAITAVHSVVIKKSLKAVNGSALALSWYMNSLSAVLLFPILLLAGEGPGVMKLLFNVSELTVPEGSMSPLRTFIYGSLITGLLGFLMNIASLLSIKVTSPITHMVSSAVRGVAASLLGMWLFHDIITTGRASSIGTILAGSALYTWFKHQESHDHKPATPRRGSYERVKMEDLETGAAETKESHKA